MFTAIVEADQVPEVIVPTVMILVVPAQVERAVFSTLPKLISALVRLLVLVPVTIPSTTVISENTELPDNTEDALS